MEANHTLDLNSKNHSKMLKHLPNISSEYNCLCSKYRNINDDPSYIKPSEDLIRERKIKILREINISKLENSLIKSIKGKNNSYSDKELTNILINLGENTTGLKSVHIDLLMKMKKEFDENFS